MAKKLSIEEEIAHYLRLAEDSGATQAERDLAAGRAERLMLKHAIDRATIDLEPGQEEEDIVQRHIRIDGGSGTYAWHLMMGLYKAATALKLGAYQTDLTGLKKSKIHPDLKPHRVLTLIGFESEVDSAVVILNSLQVQAMVAMKKWWSDEMKYSYLSRQEGYHARCQFLVSFGSGAATRILEERNTIVQDLPESSALVLVDRQAKVRSWMKDNLVLKNQASRRSGSSFGREAGFSAGRQANVGTRSIGGQRAIGR